MTRDQEAAPWETEADEPDVAEMLMRTFAGFGEAYGTYSSAIPSDLKGGKLEIKATARTVRSPVTLTLWREHLAGKTPLGIIPIRENNTCFWGVIDVDSYGVSLADLHEQVKIENLPLVICRSKSGGAHLFLLMSEAVPAEMMQSRLREIAALLGHGDAEIFPKQRTVDYERGDLGSWLNMPYFGGAETDRYCVKSGGIVMGLTEFAYYSESLRQPTGFLERQSFRKKPSGTQTQDPEFGDGPPCMQHLAISGYPEGMRNKGLFALAVFAKKKYGLRWEHQLEKWNRELFHPPLNSGEVQAIINSHRGKEYNYTCKEHPILAHCNSTICRSRKYGVGGEDDYPVVTGLSMLKTDPPLWFMDVGTHRLELTTDELLNYRMFHKVCAERTVTCFRMMKQDTWIAIVQNAMKDAIEIDSPVEVGLAGHFGELLEEFVVNRHRGENKEDILVGRPWENTDEGRHYFRLRDLEKFLEAGGFKTYNRPQIAARLRTLGGNSHFFNLKGKGTNVWWVPSQIFVPTPTPGLPKIEREPI